MSEIVTIQTYGVFPYISCISQYSFTRLYFAEQFPPHISIQNTAIKFELQTLFELHMWYHLLIWVCRCFIWLALNFLKIIG